MNVRLIRRVAARIRGLEFVDVDRVVGEVEGFDMADVWYECRTPSCIAGWTLAVAGVEPPKGRAIAWAGRALGLDLWQERELFTPRRTHAHHCARPGEEGFIGPGRAARCLELLAEAGEVDWEAARA